jgi:hypothetical protein
MSNFREVNPQTGFLLPPSVDEWLPEQHLARFVVEVIDRLDVSGMVKAYRGSGSASYDPSVLLGLLVFGWRTAVRLKSHMPIRSRPLVAVLRNAAQCPPRQSTSWLPNLDGGSSSTNARHQSSTPIRTTLPQIIEARPYDGLGGGLVPHQTASRVAVNFECALCATGRTVLDLRPPIVSNLRLKNGAWMQIPIRKQRHTRASTVRRPPFKLTFNVQAS